MSAPDLSELGRSVELDAALALAETGGEPITSVLFVERPDGSRLVVETQTRVRELPGFSGRLIRATACAPTSRAVV